MNQPLFEQTFASLDAIFEDYKYVAPIMTARGRPYPHNPGFVFLGGLPGSLDLRTSTALIVKPLQHIADAVSRRCCNGSIGSFSAIRSAYWMGRDLLPVWAHDTHQIAHILVGFVPYSEHDRFDL